MASYALIAAATASESGDGTRRGLRVTLSPCIPKRSTARCQQLNPSMVAVAGFFRRANNPPRTADTTSAFRRIVQRLWLGDGNPSEVSISLNEPMTKVGRNFWLSIIMVLDFASNKPVPRRSRRLQTARSSSWGGSPRTPSIVSPATGGVVKRRKSLERLIDLTKCLCFRRHLCRCLRGETSGDVLTPSIYALRPSMAGTRSL